MHGTYQEFMYWLDNGVGDGTIVTCDGHTGIFCDNGDGTYKLLAHYGENGKIEAKDIPVDIGKVQEIDGKQFYADLRKQGLQYGTTLARIYDRKIPKSYSKVIYEHDGVRGVGFVEKCSEGMVHFICGYEVKFQKGYSLPLADVDFFTIDKAGIQKLQEEMNRNCVSFDKKTMSLVEIMSRAEKGGAYWYLTDILSICREIDRRTAKDTARYDNYNYFLNFNEALDMREHIIETRKKIIKGLK